jgi:hypothetical protein
MCSIHMGLSQWYYLTSTTLFIVLSFFSNIFSRVLIQYLQKVSFGDFSYIFLACKVGAYTAKTQYRKFKTNVPNKEITRPQSCVCERFIYSQDRSAYTLLQENMWTDPGSWEYINRSYSRHMNVEIGTEAVQFPGKKYINGIFFAVKELF